MKSDLATSVLIFVVGTIMAYFAGGMFFSVPDTVTINSIGTDTSYSMPGPDPEIFNYRAINPTVEVYIGGCDSYDAEGKCIVTQNNDNTEDIPDEDQEEESDEETPEEPEEETPEEETPEEPDDGETD